MTLSDRAAVITGGASGAGRAVAHRIAREGGRVAVWDSSEEALARLAAEIGAEVTMKVDVTDPDAVGLAAEKTNDLFGRLDLLMCSAGVTGQTAPVAEYSIAEWRRVIDINLSGVSYFCQAVRRSPGYWVHQGAWEGTRNQRYSRERRDAGRVQDRDARPDASVPGRLYGPEDSDGTSRRGR